jgi:Domain of unknown function (DUF1961)
MKTIEELNKYKDFYETEHLAESGQDKIWGNTDISPLLKARGEVLYQDDFSDLQNWHHEGRGNLTLPESNILQLNCIGSKQGAAGCMAFCRMDFPDNICLEYDLRALTSGGLVITFIAACGRNGEDMITELPVREGVFADYINNPRMRCYHVSVSRYNDAGEHTGVSNWRRNPGIFMMGQQKDLCAKIGEWYHLTIVKRGPLLQMDVNGELAGGFIDPDEIPESMPSVGKIGFRAIGSEVIAQIKNFKVTALD